MVGLSKKVAWSERIGVKLAQMNFTQLEAVAKERLQDPSFALFNDSGSVMGASIGSILRFFVNSSLKKRSRNPQKSSCDQKLSFVQRAQLQACLSLFLPAIRAQLFYFFAMSFYGLENKRNRH